MAIIQLLVFLLILSILIIIHELGHFLVARKNGIKVEEFGFGYPPKAFTLFKDKEGTEYTFNWLPFGGFVRLHGEDGEASVKAVESNSKLFYNKSKKVRLGVILAGVFINFLFGVLAFSIVYTKTGIPEEVGPVKIQEVLTGSPADQAGLKQGDIVTGISDQNGNLQGEFQTTQDFVSNVSSLAGENINLLIQRDGDSETATVYVRKEDERPKGQGAIGVSVSREVRPKEMPLYQRPIYGIWYGLKTAFALGALILGFLGTTLRDLFSGGPAPEGVSGIIGISHQVVKQSLLSSALDALNFAGLLSINLAIINLLPFPALDGGRAMFIALEGILGKRMKPKFEQWANIAGMLILVTLMVLISFNDLKVLFNDSAFQEWIKKLF